MMISGELYKRISTIFGMDAINTHTLHKVKSDTGEVIEKFRVLSYWMAEIHYFQQSSLIRNEVTLAVVKSDLWQRGVILVPPLERHSTEEYVGPKPLHPLELSSWEDPVAAALGSINLLPGDMIDAMIGMNLYHYTIDFGTKVAFGSLHLKMQSKDPSYERLWNALMTTVHHFVDTYDDEKMKAFIYTW